MADIAKGPFLNEKTHRLISLGNAITLIMAMLSAVVFFVNFKSDTEHGISTNTTSIESERELRAKENAAIINAVDKNNSKFEVMNPVLVELQSDVKWIRSMMEKK